MVRSHGFLGRFGFATLVLAAVYNLYRFSLCSDGDGTGTRWIAAVGAKGRQYDHESLLLDEAQCQAAFPLLTREIEGAVAAGPFRFNRSTDDYMGQTHGRIKDGKLYVIATSDRASQDMANERDAVFHLIQRAIQTSPSPVPDIVFTISVLDDPRPRVWSFSRPSTLSDKGKYWLMPHFSFWSWPKPFIGSIDQGLAQIERVERETPWEKKIGKVVWRGTTHFNSVQNLNLRPQLLQVTKGKDWADVEEIKWEKQGMAANNSIAVHNFCRYKYIVYTEGITYSGRLPFHQACESIILSTPPNFLLHNTHLMRPFFSTDLGYSKPTAFQEKQIKARWPKSYPASEANVVFIGPNWQDLEQTVMYLEDHQSIAKAIAKRQRDTMVGGGYLSPASNACYWRALIKAWSKVAKINEADWKDSDGGLGMRWETFTLQKTLDKFAVS